MRDITRKILEQLIKNNEDENLIKHMRERIEKLKNSAE